MPTPTPTPDKFKGIRLSEVLLKHVDKERCSQVPPLTFSDMLRQILAERYAKKAVRK